MLTTTDHFEVFDDATFVDLGDRFDDVLTEPVDQHRDVMSLIPLLTPLAITIPPSDLPAAELPDYEPTAADLLAVEATADEEIEARIASANTLSAFEGTHRALLRLRAALPIATLTDEPDDTASERAA